MVLPNNDPELEAMQQMLQALSGLDEGAKRRVLTWAVDKYGLEIPRGRIKFAVPPAIGKSGEVNAELNSQDLADLFELTQPSTDADRVLVACYWIQNVKGESAIDSFEVNTQLKHLGHPIGNITRTFSSLINRKPQLIQQTRKTGSTKQARKKYKITLEGIKSVEEMSEKSK